MARHFKNVPELAPDENSSDSTVASPALGYGMERVDFLDTREPEDTPEQPRAIPERPQPTPQQPQPAPTPESTPEVLGRNEVAAVSTERTYYVNDVPSPYLSSKQAREDVRVARRRFSRISAIIITLIILSLLGAGGWFVWTSVQSQRQQTTVKQYETRVIEGGEYLETIDTTSLVQPANQVVVTSDVSGTIAEVFVENDGDVQEGSVIFRLDNPTITDALTKAQEAVDSAREDVTRKQEALDKANEVVTTTQELVDKDDKNEAAKAALEAAKTSAASTQTELDNATNNLWSLQETLEQAQEQEQKLTILAPISGKVSELSTQAESNGSISSSTRLCTISDTSQFSIVMEIPKADASRVQVGQEVRLSFPSIEDLNITSTVSSIDESGDALMATVLIADPDERITTGLAAEASLILKSIPDTYIVPSSVLRTDENGTTHVDVLLDPTRGIVTDVQVNVLATDGKRAAIEADSIQADTAVIVQHPEEAQQQQ